MGSSIKASDRALAALGATVSAANCNINSMQNEVAAALAHAGKCLFCWSTCGVDGLLVVYSWSTRDVLVVYLLMTSRHSPLSEPPCAWDACNIYSTQNEVAAALAHADKCLNCWSIIDLLE